MVRRDKFIDPERINEIIAVLEKFSKEQHFHFALVGGVAIQYLGSDRLTKDVDVVADTPMDPEGKFTALGPIDFGGTAYQTASGGKLDFIIRNDDFQKLYEKALEEAIITEDGFPMVTPDYLAAMKFIAHITDHSSTRRVIHLSDLKWLLSQPGLVDPKKVEALIYRYAGGRLPQESFKRVVDEVRFEQQS